jgi:hypothetical protein
MYSPSFEAPIPGENYTSDTRNYPWHRPPEITDYDEALEWSVQHLTDPENGFRYIGLMKAGASIASVTDMHVTKGIMDGKWTVDFALLIAGPIARILQIMAKSYGLDPEMGTDQEYEIISDSDIEAAEALAIDQQMAEEAFQEASETLPELLEEPEPTLPSTGLMGAPTGPLMAPEGTDDQMSMLGYGPEAEEIPQ